jgi:metal-responsive CopG/Arc/MetJ family transcriptional regulator
MSNIPKPLNKRVAPSKASKPQLDQRCVKIAISVPNGDYRRIEEICEGENLSRSNFIVLAVREWIETASKKVLIEQYTQGYELFPEDTTVVKALVVAQNQLLARESW